MCIEEVIFKDGKTCYTINEPYNTKRYFYFKKVGGAYAKKYDEQNPGMLNLVNLVERYNADSCIDYYNEDIEQDEEGYTSHKHDIEYWARLMCRTYEEGLFLHLSDNGSCYLHRNAYLSLLIDQKKSYKLASFFAPVGSRISNDFTTDIYFKINTTILKALALSSSIKLSYNVPNDTDEHFNFENLNISSFQKHALFYYENYYIEHLEDDEKKESLYRELEAYKETMKTIKAQETVTDNIKKKWEEAISYPIVAESWIKVVMMLKRFWREFAPWY